MLPAAGPFLQAMAELDSAEAERRLRELEDPISTFHPAVSELARELYRRFPEGASTRMDLDEGFVSRFERPLAILEAQGMLRLRHVLGAPPRGISHVDPFFVGYMAQLSADPHKMRLLAQQVEECTPGQWLRGEDIAADLGLPLQVVRAIFEIYASGGYGIMSNEVGTANYYCNA